MQKINENIELQKEFQHKFFVTQLNLCNIVIEPVNEFKWIMLIPRIKNIKNILDLNEIHKNIFWNEIHMMSQCLQTLYKSDQINIAMLGNITPYLHVHIIARFKNDPAWPNATFGYKNTTKSNEDNLKIMKNLIISYIDNFHNN